MSATMVGQAPKQYNRKREPDTIRFDLKTRLCTMAATIFATSDKPITPGQAVDLAGEIENAANAKCISMKRSNPQPRRD